VTYSTGNARFVGSYDLLVERPSGNMNFSWYCHSNPACTMNVMFETNNGFTAKADLETMHLSHPISIEVHSQSNYTSQKKAEIMATMLGESHMLNVEYAQPRITVIATSNLIGGTFRGEGTLTRGLMKMNFAHALRTLDMSIEYSNGINAIISYKKEEYYNAIELILTPFAYGFSGSFVVKQNNSEHKLETTINSMTPAFDLKISSPKLEHDIISNANIEIQPNRSMMKASVVYGNIVNSFQAGYAYSQNAANIVLEIETPFFELHKLTLKSDLELSENVRADATLELFGEMHSFELRSSLFSRSTQRFTCTIISPKLPGQIFKIEGDVSGLYPESFVVTSMLQFNNQTFSSKLNMDLRSLNSVYSSLEVKTPFEGYRRMNFILNFQHTDSMILNLTADSPVNMKLEIQSGRMDTIYKTVVHIETPVEGYEKIVITAETPLDKTATRVMINLPNTTYGFEFEFGDDQYSKTAILKFLSNDTYYGGGFKLRYKAPYVLDLNVVNKRFHVMMDSSVFNILYSCILI